MTWRAPPLLRLVARGRIVQRFLAQATTRAIYVALVAFAFDDRDRNPERNDDRDGEHESPVDHAASLLGRIGNAGANR